MKAQHEKQKLSDLAIEAHISELEAKISDLEAQDKQSKDEISSTKKQLADLSSAKALADQRALSL